MNTASTSTPDAKLRWGFVGTGTIANWMADVLRTTPSATLAAVASRRRDTAEAFASRHDAVRPFDSWSEMLAWDGIDAVYVATPTGLREEICVAAAGAGKHVLGEKPFASLPSLRRIIAACREHGVSFMDATHFVHHPRHAAIQSDMTGMIGRPQSLESSFLVSITDRGDIRYDPALEPLGAIGDLGWYNMRATVEYLSSGAALRSVNASLRRDEATGAIIAGEGSLVFEDDTVSRWCCGFDGSTVDIGLSLSGPRGVIRMANFVGEEEDASAGYRYTIGDESGATEEPVTVISDFSGPAMMFEDFAAAVRVLSLRQRWTRASEATQALVDAVMRAGQA